MSRWLLKTIGVIQHLGILVEPFKVTTARMAAIFDVPEGPRRATGILSGFLNPAQRAGGATERIGLDAESLQDGDEEF